MSTKENQMPAKKPVYTIVTEVDGSISISDNGREYTFQEPRGKTLVALERYKVANPDSTEIEDMAQLMSLLEVEGYPADMFLDLPLPLFKFIANELNQFFRTDDGDTV